MKTKVRVQVVCCLAALVATSAAYACPACGDKLNFGSSGFERMTRRSEPGNLLLVAAAGSPLGSPEGPQAALKRAGHHVVSVAGPDEIGQALAEHGADVVIVHWSEVPAVEAKLAGAAPAPTIVPVAYQQKDAAEANAAGIDDCLERTDQRSGRKLLASIDRILEQRRKGVESACVVKVASRTD